MNRTLRRVALSALVLSVACIPQLAGPVPVSELRFFDANQNVILDLVTPNEFVWQRSLLGPVPTTAPEGVDFIATGTAEGDVRFTNLQAPQMEAHLFKQDLDALQATYDGYLADVTPTMFPPPPTSQSAFARKDAWHAILENFDIEGNSVLDDAVIPFAPNTAWDLSQRYAVNPLLKTDFGAAVGSTDPQTGAIQTVRVLRPGLCAFNQPYTQPDDNGLLDQVSDVFWSTIFGYIDGQGGNVARQWSEVTARLDRRGSDPIGGFELAFEISIGSPACAGPCTEMVGVYDVAFDIGADGVLTGDVDDGDNVTSPTDQNTHDTFDAQIVGKIGSGLHDAAAGKQWHDVPFVLRRTESSRSDAGYRVHARPA